MQEDGGAEALVLQLCAGPDFCIQCRSIAAQHLAKNDVVQTSADVASWMDAGGACISGRV